MAGSAPTELPAYVQLRYEENGVLSAVQRDASNVAGIVQTKFSAAFDSVGVAAKRAMDQALSSASTGSLDLGVGQFREQARAKQEAARASEQLALASARVAEAEGAGSIGARQAAEAFAALATKQHAAAVEATEPLQKRRKHSTIRNDTEGADPLSADTIVPEAVDTPNPCDRASSRSILLRVSGVTAPTVKGADGR